MAQPLNAGAVNAPSGIGAGAHTGSPAYQAYQILHAGFTIAPILAGLDKFFHLLVNWDQYLAPLATRIIPIGAHPFMLAVGAIEVIAGLLVAFKPKIGGYVVAAWLLGIVVNLLLHPGSYDGVGWGLDIALRDFGLSLGALALARLAHEYDRR
jgi:hypothetical protein